MLLEAPRNLEIMGSVKINEVQKILKLESNSFDAPPLFNISKDEIDEIMNRMMIVIPTKNERLNLLDNVLKAIPQNCHIALVSNSQRNKRDVYRGEQELINNFHNLTNQSISMIHQKDPGLADAFKSAGYTKILDESGLIRDGKAEGMIAATVLANYYKKDYIGFIDADNYIPGAVNEYVKDYAAGFAMSKSPYAMVRLHWRYKPKIVGRKLYFKKWGRVSETTNRFLNLLLAINTQFEVDIIKTGNAGEHAMSTKLANLIDYSTGYSIEPYHFIYLLEEFGGKEIKKRDVAKYGVDVFQIETLNPHLHEDKGERHVANMLIDSLSTIFHSNMANDQVRSEILEELRRDGAMGNEQNEPRKSTKLPSIGNIDASKFMRTVISESKSFADLS